MTQPAIASIPTAGELLFAIDLAHVQSVMNEPTDETLCTHLLSLENRSFPTSTPTVQDIISCDGQDLSDEQITRLIGGFDIEFFADDIDLAWAAAVTYGSCSAPASIGASNAVYSLAISATGGTYRLIFNGRSTAALAWNANAAAIQAAIDALLGAGLWVVGGTGPWSLTAAGANLNAEVLAPRVTLTKLTGGTATITPTTEGGPARKSYTITKQTEKQLPAFTAVIGYQSGSAWRMADIVVNQFAVSLEDSGLYRVRMGLIWSGLYDKLTGFTFAGCAARDLLESKYSKVLFGATNVTDEISVNEFSLQNNARIDSAYTNVLKIPQRLERADLRPQTFKMKADESDDSVYDLVMANNQEGTRGGVTSRIGSAVRGVTINAPETVLRMDGGANDTSGPGGAARVPVLIRCLNSTSAADRPTSITALTSYAGGFLALA